MSYSIGQLSKKLGLSADTLRYYEKIRLLPKAARNAGGQRFYTDKDVSRLRFVQRAQSMAFTLAEIQQLLRFRDNPVKASPKVRKLAQSKFDTVAERLTDIQHLHAEFALLLTLCRGQTDSCPILDTLDSNRFGNQDTRENQRLGTRAGEANFFTRVNVKK